MSVIAERPAIYFPGPSKNENTGPHIQKLLRIFKQ